MSEHGISENPPTSAPEHAHAPATGSPAFSPTEVVAFRDDDIAAGRHIVQLMVGIFLIGIVIYLIVDYAVFTTPQIVP